ncbi:hypothetical protein SASPL_101850 [Salvia splendens]|uniref:Dirigent protein n=1 Tax=Salvia splendens TaxID=180675 RepID=A0A4D8Z9G1_SALSN|nr:hypothetical protein SASPL_157630 [Salvia splendens]KAG6383618.1 hypothetical protein SASPL_156618 [Salvia splendens]KAG6436944.1 hypothetical protein SASPL_101850 [Salvia splendens]
MARKLMLFHMLMALSMLTARLEARGKFPIVHFIDAMSRPIDLHIRSGGLSSSAQLQPGQDYGMRLKVDDVHSVMSVCGSTFASFNAYEPARDKGYAAVFWRGSYKGFYMSHNKVHWNLVARWEYE